MGHLPQLAGLLEGGWISFKFLKIVCQTLLILGTEQKQNEAGRREEVVKGLA